MTVPLVLIDRVIALLNAEHDRSAALNAPAYVVAASLKTQRISLARFNEAVQEFLDVIELVEAEESPS